MKREIAMAFVLAAMAGCTEQRTDTTGAYAEAPTDAGTYAGAVDALKTTWAKDACRIISDCYNPYFKSLFEDLQSCEAQLNIQAGAAWDMYHAYYRTVVNGGEPQDMDLMKSCVSDLFKILDKCPSTELFSMNSVPSSCLKVLPIIPLGQSCASVDLTTAMSMCNPITAGCQSPIFPPNQGVDGGPAPLPTICVTKTPLGGDCSSVDCAGDLLCDNSNKCVAPPKAGEPCAFVPFGPRTCERDAYCWNDLCVKNTDHNQCKGPSHCTGFQQCDMDAGLCENVVAVKLGEPCDDAIRICEYAGYCDPTAKKCLARVAAGAACDSDASAGGAAVCLGLNRCANGTCVPTGVGTALIERLAAITSRFVANARSHVVGNIF